MLNWWFGYLDSWHLLMKGIGILRKKSSIFHPKKPSGQQKPSNFPARLRNSELCLPGSSIRLYIFFLGWLKVWNFLVAEKAEGCFGFCCFFFGQQSWDDIFFGRVSLKKHRNKFVFQQDQGPSFFFRDHFQSLPTTKWIRTINQLNYRGDICFRDLALEKNGVGIWM